MNILVLGGAGLQGRAALLDLTRSSEVKRVVCADASLGGIEDASSWLDLSRIEQTQVDASDAGALAQLFGSGVDIVVDLLPAQFITTVLEAAAAARVHVVNTMYASAIPAGFHERAIESGITVLPEMGLDPGIDLILCAHAAAQLDEVYELHSYCGGVPEPRAIDNPLKYKITWTWDGVLKSYKRPARFLRDGEVVEVKPPGIYEPEWLSLIEFPDVGQLEAILNGDAIVFAKQLGLLGQLRNTTRCSLRWPGHSQLWLELSRLGLLSDEPVPGLPGGITPHQFMVRHLGPKLQYGRNERDLVVMRNTVIGRRGSEPVELQYDMVDVRDPETGLFAMNRTVGFTASIAAQMIGRGEIPGLGILSPVVDVPSGSFLRALGQRGIEVRESVTRA